VKWLVASDLMQHFRLSFWPRKPFTSKRCGKAMWDCMVDVSRSQMDLFHSFRPWRRLSPERFRLLLWDQLESGDRCHEYDSGPEGWSGDDTVVRKFKGNFVGLRSDLMTREGTGLTQFALRHEFEHEIQRKIEQLTDKLGDAFFFKRFCAEIQANLAARDYVAREHLMSVASPYLRTCYLYSSALWCSLRRLGKVTLISMFTAVIAAVNLVETFDLVEWRIAKWIFPIIIGLMILKDLGSRL